MSSWSALDEETRQQIFEKFLAEMRKSRVDVTPGPLDPCPELNPDIIVISGDQTAIFEAQNERASALLRQKCGWDTETISMRERIHVHPSQSQKLIEVLSSSGLKVAS